MQDTIKEKLIINEIGRLLPNVQMLSVRAGDKDKVHNCHYFVPTQNEYLSNSDYFYSDDSNLIHFTDFDALQSIISTRNIRLYNLHNLNDPREYSFAGNTIEFNKQNKADARENFYLLSMCESSLFKRNIGIEYNMWKLYGRNGEGICIELKFENNRKNWKDYFLGKVFYGAKYRAKFESLDAFLKSHNSELPLVNIDLGQLFCFHKSQLFNLEREVRLLYDHREFRNWRFTEYLNRNNRIVSPIIKIDNKKQPTNSVVKYLELPIYNKKFIQVHNDDAIPIPKIEKIILGHQFKDSFNTVSDDLKRLCKQYLGYCPLITKSRITKYYYEI